MARTTANEVANYILCRVHEWEDLVSNLKIQKLVYYAQAWFLALYDEPLFDDRLEAWVHGPVQPALYQRFKKYSWEPITEEVVCPDYSQDIKAHLEEILDIYGDLTAHHLERLVHQEDPWRKARGDLPPDAHCTNPVAIEDMKIFYRSLLNEQN
jgi:uncharacterized phage-associated protein